MFSSRRSCLYHCRIFVRALLVRTNPSQSRLGPALFLLVEISTMSPDWSAWPSGTSRPFTFAPTVW